MQDDQLDIKELLFQYLGELWRRRYLVLVIAWAVTLGGFAYVFTLPDEYTARARVYIDTQSVLNPLMQGLAVQGDTASQIDIMRRTLLTRPNIERIITDTNLDLEITTLDPERRMIQRENLINSVQDSINVIFEGNSLFRITYSHTNAETARDVAQAVMTLFREENVSDRRADISVSRRFIDRQIEEYERRLIDAELRVAQFRRDNADVLQRTESARGRLETVQSQIRQLQLELQSAIWRRDQIDLQLAQTPRHGEGGGPLLVAGGEERCGSLAESRQTLLLSLTEQHPNIRELDRLMQAYGCFGGDAVLGANARSANLPGGPLAAGSGQQRAEQSAPQPAPAGPGASGGGFGSAFPSSALGGNNLGEVGGALDQLAATLQGNDRARDAVQDMAGQVADAGAQAVGNAVAEQLAPLGPLAPQLADAARDAAGNEFAALGELGTTAVLDQVGLPAEGDEPTNPEYLQLEQVYDAASDEINLIQQRINFFETQLAEVRQDIEQVPEVQLRLNQLNRDYEALRNIYNDLIERRESARLAQNLEDQSSNVEVRVVEPPILPVKPSGPDRMTLSLGALVFGLGLGLGAALALAQLNNSYRSLQDLKRSLRMPVLGGVSEYDPGAVRRALTLDLPIVAAGFTALVGMTFVFVYMQTVAGLRVDDIKSIVSGLL